MPRATPAIPPHNPVPKCNAEHPNAPCPHYRPGATEAWRRTHGCALRREKCLCRAPHPSALPHNQTLRSESHCAPTTDNAHTHIPPGATEAWRRTPGCALRREKCLCRAPHPPPLPHNQTLRSESHCAPTTDRKVGTAYQCYGGEPTDVPYAVKNVYVARRTRPHSHIIKL